MENKRTGGVGWGPCEIYRGGVGVQVRTLGGSRGARVKRHRTLAVAKHCDCQYSSGERADDCFAGPRGGRFLFNFVGILVHAAQHSTPQARLICSRLRLSPQSSLSSSSVSPTRNVSARIVLAMVACC